MNRDLIFHIVSKRKWRDANKDGVYKPYSEDDEESVEFVWPVYLNEYLNEKFRGRKNLFILVVDVNRLNIRLTSQKEERIVKAGTEIHNEAILDKIRIDCGTDGLFDLEIESK